MASAARASIGSAVAAARFNLTSRRGLSAAADHTAVTKINLWEDPMGPSKWKEEHFVLASLSGWGLLIYGGLKAFGGKKVNKQEVITSS